MFRLRQLFADQHHLQGVLEMEELKRIPVALLPHHFECCHHLVVQLHALGVRDRRSRCLFSAGVCHTSCGIRRCDDVNVMTVSTPVQ